MLRSAIAVCLFVVLQSPDEQLIRAARGQSNAAIAKHDLDGIDQQVLQSATLNIGPPPQMLASCLQVGEAVVIESPRQERHCGS